MLEALDNLSQEFRSAILAGDHHRAGQLATEYRHALQQVWLSLREHEREASPLPKQAGELLTWALEVTKIQRTLAAQHLAIVEKAGRYRYGINLTAHPGAVRVSA